MTITEQILTISLCALATMLTRFLPFIVFSENKKTPYRRNDVGASNNTVTYFLRCDYLHFCDKEFFIFVYLFFFPVELLIISWGSYSSLIIGRFFSFLLSVTSMRVL